MKRGLPDLRELAPLLQFDLPRLDRVAARLESAADIWDLRRIAKRVTPTAPFDYVDGAALDERTLAKNREVLGNVELLPRILHGVDAPDTSTTIAGARTRLPFGIAPTGYTRMMHSAGEVAGVRAAAKAGIPFSLSTMGTTSVEDVAQAAPDSTRWFQLYLWKDRQRSLDLIQRAAASGYETLLVTVDTPITGQRLRDHRNGLTIPPRLTLRTILDASYRPGWWFNFLTTEPPKYASLSNTSQSLAEMTTTMFDPTLDLEDLRWIREHWNGRLFVKGILTADDAQRARSVGADGLVVSNHGGRQLDRAPDSLTSLAEVRAEVGPDMELIFDSGIMSGTDVVTALCAGADFVLIGRAYLYGLMAGGQRGVERAIALIQQEILTAMGLMGARSISDLGPDLVRGLPQAPASDQGLPADSV
ncbi:L-lactate dehydrogenase (cytochrome) [Brevibacterium siliguriense]|uniref:L-lactate dehydrogenase (Cytochrome) n=1 Tax=Brevibacterium siliguriense TaxID=1136497 RepID=A0A1H1VIV8_9MICO|nr:alpha-hydroxy acid oxidase [Brevibacterium siliguriense]SDS84798.1 L-lactate dehydrogenase (cytochrome) [Brevibacterium siliguriense]